MREDTESRVQIFLRLRHSETQTEREKKGGKSHAYQRQRRFLEKGGLSKEAVSRDIPNVVAITPEQ